MQTYNKSIKSDNLQLIYKIIHTTYKKSIKTYNPLQEVYNPSLQVVYPPQHHPSHHHHHHWHHYYQRKYENPVAALHFQRVPVPGQNNHRHDVSWKKKIIFKSYFS